jgi:hypothetical protein
MIRRTEERLGLKPNRLAADTAYGTGKFLGWLMETGITPQIPVWGMSTREDGTFSAVLLLHCKCRLVALVRHGKIADGCPLSGANPDIEPSSPNDRV